MEPAPEQPRLTSPLVDLFLELCAIPSPSGRERAVADRVGAFLTDLGLEWDEDDAASKLGGDAGNLYCRIPGGLRRSYASSSRFAARAARMRSTSSRTL